MHFDTQYLTQCRHPDPDPDPNPDPDPHVLHPVLVKAL
jgi:hypothetical protein